MIDQVLLPLLQESQLHQLLVNFETTKALMAQEGVGPGAAAKEGSSSDVDVSGATLYARMAVTFTSLVHRKTTLLCL